MPKPAKSTQDFIAIREIRDGVVILKNGNYRAVLLASSINFSLKSEDERQGLILQYQNFLNSLDFSIQIHLESRKLDIIPYLKNIEEVTKDNSNELIKIQAREYINFIKTFTEETNIMSKSFFVIIPYDPPVINNKQGLISSLPVPFLNKNQTQAESTESFEQNKNQLEQRMSVVADGLGRIGVKTVALGTDELIELYFKMFNPGEKGVPTSAPKQQ